MCIKCEMFPMASYTNGTYFLRQTDNEKLHVMAVYLDQAAAECASDPNEVNVYTYLELSRIADEVYKEVTGERLPSC